MLQQFPLLHSVLVNISCSLRTSVQQLGGVLKGLLGGVKETVSLTSSDNT